MLEEFTDWLFGLVQDAFSALLDLLKDVFIAILELVLTAIGTALSAIPVPEFLTHGMQSILNGLGGDVTWLLGQSGLAAGLAIVGAGYGFRLVRKIVTLFQW